MKPARKTRDFSIESILADKRVRNEKRNCEDVRTKHFECTTSSEVENCGANFRSEIAEEKYGTNSELSEEHKFECENKLIRTQKVDVRKCDKNILESFDGEREINSYIEHGEFTREQKQENNYCKMSSRRDQEGKLNEKRKKQSKQGQGDQFYDGSKYLNCDFAENRCKNLRDDLNDSFETTDGKYSSFKNENKKSEFARSKTGTPEVLRDIEKLEWLQCTRYKPPKIPRKPIGKNKRKPSFYPRIPFSMFQLEFLEQKFQNSAYLTRNDVVDISDILKLPPNRIKIWFQNRRARERREFCTNV